MARTKRVRKTGRFGVRYGVGIRKRLLKVEDRQKKYYPCPSCGFEKAKRKAAGIYSCRKCGTTFAGGAYLPVTLPGSIVQKMVAQRSFAPKVKELIAATEQAKGEAEAGEKEAKEKPAKKKGKKKEKADKEGAKEKPEKKASKEKPKKEKPKKGEKEKKPSKETKKAAKAKK